MNRFAVAVALWVGLAGAAFADTIQNGFGNTFLVTNGAGVTVQYRFDADGTFTAQPPEGAAITGVYEVAGDQLCITPAGGARACTAYVADKNVGDTWTQLATDGGQITVTLQAGR